MCVRYTARQNSEEGDGDMAKKQRESDAGRALEEIQSTADKLAEWIRDHLVQVVVGIAALLLATGGVSTFLKHQDEEAEIASAELSEARGDYLLAMGAGPGSLEVPELANPAAAEPIRAEFRDALAQIADTYPGSTAAVLSRFEAGRLAQEAGDVESALVLYQAAVDEGIANPGLRGLAQQRSGQALEDLGRWNEAADAHEAAAAETGYPLRHWALADAARCRATAGDYQRARLLYQRLEIEAPTLQLPSHERSLRSDVLAQVSR